MAPIAPPIFREGAPPLLSGSVAVVHLKDKDDGVTP